MSVRGLAKRHGVHRRTVRQALADATPPTRKTPERLAPATGPYVDLVRGWLVEDLKAPRKQRHTARRVWQRLVEVMDAGADTVFTGERFGGRARLSGVETDSPNWTVFTIRDGKIASGHEYATREQALEAAGLSE